MRKSQGRFCHTLSSQKENQKILMTTYQNFKLTKVTQQKNINLCGKKQVIVANSPWNKQSLGNHELNLLIQRLDDTPEALYRAINKKNSTVKFKMISNENEQQKSKEILLIKRIQEKKRKYQEQYKKLLLMRKDCSLKTDLPFIRYIKQDEKSQVLNVLHANTKISN